MKTRYEESDNIVVRATRTVTDKMSELFGMTCHFVARQCNVTWPVCLVQCLLNVRYVVVYV